MSGATHEHRDGGWTFFIPQPESLASRELIHEVVAALEEKRGAPFRRSRHATTWKVPFASSDGDGARNIFVKRLDAARGLIGRAKAKSRATQCARTRDHDRTSRAQVRCSDGFAYRRASHERPRGYRHERSTRLYADAMDESCAS